VCASVRVCACVFAYAFVCVLCVCVLLRVYTHVYGDSLYTRVSENVFA